MVSVRSVWLLCNLNVDFNGDHVSFVKTRLGENKKAEFTLENLSQKVVSRLAVAVTKRLFSDKNTASQ